MGGVSGLVSQYGYLGLALLVFVEGFGLPAPGETAIVLAAGYAGRGQLNVVAVGVVALNGVVAGTTGMAWPRFVLFNMIGAALWVGL